ncbi:ferredoxin domain-containing protein [Eubacteriales bacterium KG127]
MIKNICSSEKDTAFQVADMMLTAAKTAPKGSGRDTVRGFVITGKEKDMLAEKMRFLGDFYNLPFFIRDGNNVDQSHAVVVLGCIQMPFGLKECAMCGFENCGEMKKGGGRCAFNITDLGIALGSAVEVASKHHVDNRIMYSAGRAAVLLRYFQLADEDGTDDIEIAYGIPLYTGSKNLFFDRNPGSILL